MVSVVGTLLSLLVFFALFGIFITQYVPLWMIDNESQFTADAQASFANLKSNLDAQLSFRSPPVYATPFVMASQGVPLIAQPTSAIMNFIPVQPGVYANVSLSVGPGGGPAFFQNFTIGTVQMILPNRYYSPQTFSLEDDAVIQSQGDTHQILVYPPSLTVLVTGSSTNITMVLVQMYGNASQTVSSGSQEVYTHFLSTQVFTSTRLAPFTARFQIGTHFPCAWSTFLSANLASQGLAASHYTLTPSTCTASNGQPHMVNLLFNSVNIFTLVLAQFSVIVGVGVE